MLLVKVKLKIYLVFTEFLVKLYSLLVTLFPLPAGSIILHSLQMRVLLENTIFLLHKIVRIAGIIRGRAL